MESRHSHVFSIVAGQDRHTRLGRAAPGGLMRGPRSPLAFAATPSGAYVHLMGHGRTSGTRDARGDRENDMSDGRKPRAGAGGRMRGLFSRALPTGSMPLPLNLVTSPSNVPPRDRRGDAPSATRPLKALNAALRGGADTPLELPIMAASLSGALQRPLRNVPTRDLMTRYKATEVALAGINTAEVLVDPAIAVRHDRLAMGMHVVGRHLVTRGAIARDGYVAATKTFLSPEAAKLPPFMRGSDGAPLTGDGVPLIGDGAPLIGDAAVAEDSGDITVIDFGDDAER